jgi:hypothetical protein
MYLKRNGAYQANPGLPAGRRAPCGGAIGVQMTRDEEC